METVVATGDGDCDGVVQEPIEDGSSGWHVAKEFAPIFHFLFSRCAATGKRFAARIHHDPHLLVEVALEAFDEQMLAVNGFPVRGRTPDHQMLSIRVDTAIYGLREISQRSGRVDPFQLQPR